MSQSQKWACGICTYENFPASIRCVMCHELRPPPVIEEHLHSSDIITNSSQRSNIISCHTNEMHPNSTVISYDPQPKLAPNYHETISSEFERKNRIYSDAVETEQLAIHGAEAASGPSSSSASKNNEINKKWKCQHCTYMNWPKSTRCIICGMNSSPSLNDLQRRISSEDESPTGSRIFESKQNKHRISNEKSSQPSSPQPGACGRQGRGNSSNLSSRCNDGQITQFPTSTRTMGRQNKSSSEESLNNAMNTNELSSPREGSTRGRHYSHESNQFVIQKDFGIDNIAKKRDLENQRGWKKSSKRQNILFLKACVGILDDNIEAVDRYLAYGGNIGRALTADEVGLLNRPSAFDVGHTLVHLAVRFQRRNILALILTPEVAKRNLKRSPAVLCPEIAEHIRHEIFNSIRVMKGDFHCHYFCDYLTFLLPIEIAGLPSSIQRLLFDELLDKDVQKELEDEFAINWCGDTDRLYALWNRSAGDCLLDSVLQATWGVFDRDNILRKAMAETMQECSGFFYSRWKEWEAMQASLLNFSIPERQCLHDWAFLLSLARQPGASLEHCHIFVLSHILRRPIIVYGVKYLKSYQGDTLGYAKFQGVYLPFLWERSFCWKSPIALGYTRGHFTALVAMENDSKVAFKGMCLGSSSDVTTSPCAYLPLMDCDRKLLPIHFTSANQGQHDAEQECILNDWLDCLVTNKGVLVARQKQGKRPPLVARMLDQWLDHYRHLSFRRLGEDGETEDEE